MIHESRHEIQLIVHSINKKNVDVPAFGVRDLVSRRSPPAETVGRFVDLAEIRFGLDDHPRHALAARSGNDEKLAEQLACDSKRISSHKEFVFKSGC